VHRLIKNRLFPALALAAALISPSAHAQAASGNDPIKLGLIDIYSGGFAFKLQSTKPMLRGASKGVRSNWSAQTWAAKLRKP
jgi:hypothetical protein